MIRQYYPQRYQPAQDVGRHHVGTVQAGDYLRDTRHGLIRVDGWIPREYMHPFRSTFMAGGHLAHVTRISDGRRMILAEQYLYTSDEA